MPNALLCSEAAPAETPAAGSSFGLPRNYLRACLLLLVAECPAHGYDLVDGVADLGVNGANRGRLYRTLRQLEADRLVESAWEQSSSGPNRRRYCLTAPGREWLAQWVRQLRDSGRHLSLYLDRAESLPA